MYGHRQATNMGSALGVGVRALLAVLGVLSVEDLCGPAGLWVGQDQLPPSDRMGTTQQAPWQWDWSEFRFSWPRRESWTFHRHLLEHVGLDSQAIQREWKHPEDSICFLQVE